LSLNNSSSEVNDSTRFVNQSSGKCLKPSNKIVGYRKKRLKAKFEVVENQLKKMNLKIDSIYLKELDEKQGFKLFISNNK
jgi:hypothetical protein